MAASKRWAAAWLVVMAVCALADGTARAQITFADPRFTAEPLFTLSPFEPNGLAFAPDGRLFVWQRNGLVWIYKDGVLLPDPFLDIRSEINVSLDNGLLGLTFDPDFTTNGRVYLLYTFTGGGSRLTRVTADPTNADVAMPGSEVVIFDAIPTGYAHVIGTVRTGLDGTLFVGVGDLSSFNIADPEALRAQNLDLPSGKILRMNVDGSPVPDNPFYDGTNSIRSRVWAYGLRNPFRFGLHPLTGEPYIGDVGWNEWEEINRGRGANFGWPCYEGNGPQPEYQERFAECRQLPASAVTAPLYTYRHTGLGGSITGGTFYTATQYPLEFRDNFFFGDYVFGTLSRMVLDASDNLVGVEPFASGLAGPVAIEQGPDGLLYYVAINTGEIGRIRFAGASVRASANPIAGYSPLVVSFSSAGSVDPGGFPLTYRWEFGDGSISTEANPIHTYTAAGVAAFNARLTVTDVVGISASATIRITVGSLPPTGTIATPADGTPVFVGDVITYQGSAVDPDQGVLAPGALGWQVLLHHNDHVHPFDIATGTGGSFTVTSHEQSASFAYEIVLNATDASGLVGRTSVVLPFNPQNLVYVNGVSLSPDTVVGGGPATATVTLSGPAPAGGVVVSLASNRPSVQVPPSVALPAGSASATVDINTSEVSSAETATISATLNGTVRTTMTVTPPPSVSTLGFIPNLVMGGTATTGLIRLTGPAASGGMTAVLSSTNSAVQVPPLVLIPGGSEQATFLVTTSSVAAEVAVTVTATLNGTVQNVLTVNPVAGGAVMSYPDRADLLADSWDFLARTAGGAARNTEQISGRLVSFDQAVHPGLIRIPADQGTPWGDNNNTRNTLFRDLPSNWTSIRMKIASFAPTARWQSACLLAYQNDDNYVVACRLTATGGQLFQVWHETAGSPTMLFQTPATATTNVLLRLDRQPATEALSAFASTDNGTTWMPLGGSITQLLTNPRLGIFVGGNASLIDFPVADIAFVHVLTGGSPPPPSPTLTVSPTTLGFTAAASGPDPSPKTVAITNTGSGTFSWTASADQSWVSVSPTVGTSPGSITVGALTAGLPPGTYNANVTITAPGTAGSPRTVPVSLTVSAPTSGLSRIEFNYASRAALLTDGWDFFARTAGGATRNTEQASGLVVSFDQGVHPGTIRIPADQGTPWGGSNNTRNTLFRDLPSNWTSIQMKIASFAPTARWQSACLLAYQNDDNYVVACRLTATGGQLFQVWHETAGSPTMLFQTPATATTNVLLRLDRQPATEALSAFASTDSGTTWIPLGGSIPKLLTNPRLGVFVGGNASPTDFPFADIAYAEVEAPASSVPTLAVAPTSVSVSGIAGGPSPAAQTLNVSNVGSGALTWNASASQPWVTLLPTGGSAPATITVGTNTTGLSAGTHTATITISSPDAGNSPQTVSVSLLLAPPPSLDVSPATLTFSGTQGGSTPPTQTVTISASDGSLAWTASVNQPWVTLSAAAGIAPSAVAVGVQAAGLIAGTHTATITISAPGATNSPRTVDLGLTLTPAPVLTLAPTSLSFAATSGGADPAPQRIDVTNTGSGTLTWTALSNQPWLTLTPSSGGAPGFVTVRPAIAALAPGVHNASITFTSPEAGNSPRAVSVALNIAPPPALDITPSGLTFTAIQGGPPPAPQTMSVSNIGGGTLTWTASADRPWVTLTPTSGGAGAVITVGVAPAGLPIGTHAATITIASPEAGNSPRTASLTIVVTAAAQRISFAYGNRAALLADGWDFLARTAGGAVRDTERTSGLVADYDQTTHPGRLRIPADLGDLWGSDNNTRNTLFRNLPTNWISIRLKVAAFTPSANWQNACLVAYENDSRYVVACRNFVNGQLFEGWHETAGNPVVLAKVAGSATTNILLRVDRDPATESLSPFFSVNDGATWSPLGGSVVKALTNPRLGIFVGANGSTSAFPNADLEYVEILAAP